MADVVDAVTRSRMMAGIRGKNTRPEMALRRTMHAAGYRFRLHDRNLPGSPDLVFPRYRAAVFVHGCFWHRHKGCQYATVPGTRADFWKEKFTGNVERDLRNINALRDSGWRTALVWECALRRDPVEASAALIRWLQDDGLDRLQVG